MHLRYLLTALVVALLTGVVCVGGLSRLAMSLLASRNPQARGRLSDDGFEMGVVTADGVLNLVVLGLVVGVVGWLLYLVARPLLFGPEWFRWFCLSVPPGVVVASMVVHPDGVDFTVLGPLWLTVGLFVAVPAAYGPLMHLAMLRVGGTPLGEGLADRAPAVAWTLRGFFVGLSVLALVSLVEDVRTLA